MKFSYHFVLLILLTSISCGRKAQSRINCTQWHTGSFEIVDENRNILIERNATVQMESDRNTGAFTKFTINWLDNCTYRLRFFEGEEGFYKVWKDNFLQVTITGATPAGYSYEARFSTSDVVERGEIVVIN